MKARWFLIDLQTGRCVGDGGERLPRDTARLWTRQDARIEAKRLHGEHWEAAVAIEEAELSEIMSRMGRAGGMSRSERKAAASRANGRRRMKKTL